MKKQNVKRNIWSLVTSLLFCFILCTNIVIEPPIINEGTAIVLENEEDSNCETEPTPTAGTQDDKDLKKRGNGNND